MKNTVPNLEALIIDVDGTLADTEEAHRLAFNQSFKQFELNWFWAKSEYWALLEVSGGKERIKYYSLSLKEESFVSVSYTHLTLPTSG